MEPIIRPIPLLYLDHEDKLKLREETLRDLLDSEKLKGRQLAVLSIVGAFRTGKSFLMNLLLRYLRHKGADDWLEKDGSLAINPDISGFPFKHGSERDTLGILVWPEVFTVGDDLAILLMDTQGMFDLEESTKVNSQIFSLSTLMSSIQIFNVNKQLQMDVLHNLQFFLEFGKMFTDDVNLKPFNRIMFLIRDWMYCKEFEYGLEGGNKMAESKWKVHGSSIEKKKTWDSIEYCFTNIDCFLMPHPGFEVATGDEFTGELSEIREVFLKHSKILAAELLSPEKVVVKTVCGQPMRTEKFLSYVCEIFDTLLSNTLEPKSIHELMVKTTKHGIMSEAIKLYLDSMMEKPYATSENLWKSHEESIIMVTEHFYSQRIFGGEATVSKCLEQMKQIVLQSNESNAIAVEEAMKEYCAMFVNSLENMQINVDLTEIHNAAFVKALHTFECHPNTKDGSVTINIFLKHLKQVTSKVHEINKEAMQTAKTLYTSLMAEKCTNAVDDLFAVHVKAFALAMQEFDKEKSHDLFETWKVYRKNLRQQLNELFSSWNESNNRKNYLILAEMDPEELWKHQCKKQQSEAYSMLGDRDYDAISFNSNEILEMKIGFAFYGNTNNSEYSDIQKENIKNIADRIDKAAKSLETNEIHFSVIYIFRANLNYKKCKKDVIIRIGGVHSSDVPFFIEESKRTYKGWSDFLENNKYEENWLCYPKGGIYHSRHDGSVDLEITKSCACNVFNKTKKVGDVLSVTAITAGLGVATVGLFAAPIVAPIAGASMAVGALGTVYSGARGVSTLVDRHLHDESINFTNFESICAWMDIVATPFVFATSITKLLSTTTRISRWGNLLANGFKMTNVLDLGACLSAKSLSFTLQLWKMLIESENGELSSENIYLLRSQLLFYFHVFISNDRAQEIFQTLAKNMKDFLDTEIERVASNIVSNSLTGNILQNSLTLLSLTICDNAESLLTVFTKNALSKVSKIKP